MINQSLHISSVPSWAHLVPCFFGHIARYAPSKKETNCIPIEHTWYKLIFNTYLWLVRHELLPTRFSPSGSSCGQSTFTRTYFIRFQISSYTNHVIIKKTIWHAALGFLHVLPCDKQDGSNLPMHYSRYHLARAQIPYRHSPLALHWQQL